MIALITQREQVDKYCEPVDILEASYVKYFESLGVELLSVSNFTSDVKYYFEQVKVDLVILTGGGSVPKEYYSIATDEINQTNRDKVEGLLIEECLKRNIPILGICRGMQFLNGYFGGKIEKLQNLKIPRVNGKDHSVYSSILEKKFMVNNFHNDGVLLSGLAECFTTYAVDEENNTIEAFISKEKKILALQWHPERNFETEEAKLFSRSLVSKFLNDIVQEEEVE